MSIAQYHFAQTTYQEIDAIAIYQSEIPNYKLMANSLTNSLESEEQKARVIFTWIAHNIQYNFDKLGVTYTNETTTHDVAMETFKDRNGVCYHYSELYKAMCEQVGLEVYTVDGYTMNQKGALSDVPHQWNVVKIEDDYKIVDPTWGAGHVSESKHFHFLFDDQYFFMDPELSIHSHLPFDPVWQLLDNPITGKEFVDKNYERLIKKGEFHYKDSIAVLPSSNSIDGIMRLEEKMKQFHEDQEHSQKRLTYLKKKIAYLRCNKAVDTMNYSVAQYNTYVGYKNKQFKKPKLQDTIISLMKHDFTSSAYYAQKEFNSIDTDDLNLLGELNRLRSEISTYMLSVEKEKDFVERYLATKKFKRPFMKWY